jgi:hypothetical protein
MKRRLHLVVALPLLAFIGIACSHGRSAGPSEAVTPVALQAKIPATFRFVAYGDTRFHDPSDTLASNPAARRALVRAIDRERPAFISIGGDIVYVGDSPDWTVWDSETAAWREHKIPVYPALGNHDVKGDLAKALGGYFARFPELHDSRFYSVTTENAIMLVLDSNQDELSGTQGNWLRAQFHQIPSSSDFVFLVFHYPVYTSSSDEKFMGGGHSSRSAEEALGQFLEDQQKHLQAHIVVFNGHVHNYERHEHGGVTYFVTGGGGAHAYPVARKPEDPFQDAGINYHYLLGEVDHKHLTVTMKKVELEAGREVWTQPDKVSISVPSSLPASVD